MKKVLFSLIALNVSEVLLGMNTSNTTGSGTNFILVSQTPRIPVNQAQNQKNKFEAISVDTMKKEFTKII